MTCHSGFAEADCIWPACEDQDCQLYNERMARLVFPTSDRDRCFGIGCPLRSGCGRFGQGRKSTCYIQEQYSFVALECPEFRSIIREVDDERQS